MANSLAIVVTDNIPDEHETLALVKAWEHKQRTDLIERWHRDGHLSVVNDNDPHNIRLQVDTEFFAEPRDVFPSSVLVAKIQLALGAGLSDRMREKEGMVYGHQHHVNLHHQASRRHAAGSWLLEAGYSAVAKITAPVTKARAARGLRP